MDSLLLSRITKDFFNLDLEFFPGRERYRLGWAGSVLAPHPEAPLLSAQKKAIALLLALRNRLLSLFEKPHSSSAEPPSPRLLPPISLPPLGLQPLQYFSKGALEQPWHKTMRLPFDLLTENQEMIQARPVPGSSLFLRSLCKGKGVLRKNLQGLVYLDVEPRFAAMLLPYLRAQGLAMPPYFNFPGEPEGAHIPVLFAREAAFQSLEEMEGLGQEFSFQIEGLYSTEPTSWPEVEQVWFFKLQAPSLEDWRRRHFLPPSPGGHGFHIAIAVKSPVTTTPPSKPMPWMRVNHCIVAA